MHSSELARQRGHPHGDDFSAAQVRKLVNANQYECALGECGPEKRQGRRKKARVRYLARQCHGHELQKRAPPNAEQSALFEIRGKGQNYFAAKFAAQILGIKEEQFPIDPSAELEQSLHEPSAGLSRRPFDFFTRASIRAISELSAAFPRLVRR